MTTEILSCYSELQCVERDCEALSEKYDLVKLCSFVKRASVGT